MSRNGKSEVEPRAEEAQPQGPGAGAGSGRAAAETVNAAREQFAAILSREASTCF